MTHPEPRIVLALVRSDSNGPTQAPVITGTNTRSFHDEPMTRERSESCGDLVDLCKLEFHPIDDGQIKWTYISSFTLCSFIFIKLLSSEI